MVISEDAKSEENSGNTGFNDSDVEKTSGVNSDNDEDDLDLGNRITDRYGFFVTDKFHQGYAGEITEAESRAIREKEISRTKKWIKMIKNWQKHFIYKGESESSELIPFNAGFIKSKLKRRIRKGIPDNLRGSIWIQICKECSDALINLLSERTILFSEPGSPNARSNSDNDSSGNTSTSSRPLYGGGGSSQKEKENSLPLDIEVVNQIDRDVGRTFPRHFLFYKEGDIGQSALCRILVSYAKIDREVGYCQGMAFVAAVFLTYLAEEDAFFCLCSIMTRTVCPLRDLYLPGLEKLKERLFVTERLVETFLPNLWSHMSGEGIRPSMFATEWIMTMYSRGFSFDLVTQVWDIFLAEGQFKIVYRVCLAILKYVEKELLECPFEHIMSVLRELPKRVHAPGVMAICWNIPLKTQHIRQWETVYAKQQHIRVLL